jgi:hypothetical protein
MNQKTAKSSYRFRYVMLITVVLYAAAFPLFSQTPEPVPESVKLTPVLQSFSDQMTQEGYQCAGVSQDKELFLHCQISGSDRPDFRIHEYNGGYRIFTFFMHREGVTYESETLRALVNDLNENAVLTRYYIDRDADVAAEFWYPLSVYDKNLFSAMTHSFFRDWTTAISNYADRFRQLFK